jgi:hypothetical protein
MELAEPKEQNKLMPFINTRWLNTHCSFGYVRLLLTLSAHPIGKILERKTKEWKRTPSTQYGDIGRQYSNYNKINTKKILIVINTIKSPPQSKSKILMNNFKTEQKKLFTKFKSNINQIKFYCETNIFLLSVSNIIFPKGFLKLSAN